jgi:hypothetical protein
LKTLVHRIRMAWRIEDGLFGWIVSAIFDGHIFPLYGNHTTRLDRSRDRPLTHKAPPYESEPHCLRRAGSRPLIARRYRRYHKYITAVCIPSAHHGRHKGITFSLCLDGWPGVTRGDVTQGLTGGRSISDLNHQRRRPCLSKTSCQPVS